MEGAVSVPLCREAGGSPLPERLRPPGHFGCWLSRRAAAEPEVLGVYQTCTCWDFSSTAGKPYVSCSRTPVPNTAQNRRARFFSSVGGLSSLQLADSQAGVCPSVRPPFAPRLLWSGAGGGCPVPACFPVLPWHWCGTQQRASRSRSSSGPCGRARAQPGCCAPSQRGGGHMRILRANSG